MNMTPTTDKAQNCKPAAEYRTDAPREDGWTFERQATFLMALAETGLVSAACKIAEMSVTSAYALRREARGVAFHLGWQAAHLLARDRLEDVLLEAAISGVESVTTRIEKTTHRRVLNGNLSMAVLNRLDARAAALDDRAMSTARSIGSAFEDFICVVLAGGGAQAIAAFLSEHPDPLTAQVEASKATAPKLVEKSAIFIAPPAHTPRTFDPIAALSPSPTPCDCHADRDLVLNEAA
jgi:hypothetical protein